MGDQENLDRPELFPDLPVRARRCDPLSVSADCKQVCRCDDGSDYAIKEAATIATMPHNEWLCAKLAERVGVAAPSFKIVEVQGVQCFGSRWLAGEESNWWNRAHGGQIPFADLAPAISRILALDLFVHNGDRHLKNYFVLKQQVGYSAVAMDFGRAWLFNGMPPPDLPMQPSENTIAAQRALKVLFGDFIDQQEVGDVCDRLLGVTDGEIAGFISSHPSSWLQNSQKKDILDWWKSDARTGRVQTIKEGIINGSLV